MTIAGSAASNGTHIIDAESGHAVAPREDLGYETLYFLFLS